MAQQQFNPQDSRVVNELIKLTAGASSIGKVSEDSAQTVLELRNTIERIAGGTKKKQMKGYDNQISHFREGDSSSGYSSGKANKMKHMKGQY